MLASLWMSIIYIIYIICIYIFMHEAGDMLWMCVCVCLCTETYWVNGIKSISAIVFGSIYVLNISLGSDLHFVFTELAN